DLLEFETWPFFLTYRSGSPYKLVRWSLTTTQVFASPGPTLPITPFQPVVVYVRFSTNVLGQPGTDDACPEQFVVTYCGLQVSLSASTSPLVVASSIGPASSPSPRFACSSVSGVSRPSSEAASFACEQAA